MTRKHFIELADNLRFEQPDATDSERYAQWVRDVEAVADACGHFNGQFDRSRFLRACGLDR